MAQSVTLPGCDLVVIGRWPQGIVPICSRPAAHPDCPFHAWLWPGDFSEEAIYAEIFATKPVDRLGLLRHHILRILPQHFRVPLRIGDPGFASASPFYFHVSQVKEYAAFFRPTTRGPHHRKLLSSRFVNAFCRATKRRCCDPRQKVNSCLRPVPTIARILRLLGHHPFLRKRASNGLSTRRPVAPAAIFLSPETLGLEAARQVRGDRRGVDAGHDSVHSVSAWQRQQLVPQVAA